MVSTAVLDLASLDPTSDAVASRTEKAIKLMSMANLMDHGNAMVQNHLANHYFWKWTQASGTVSVSQGSDVIEAHNLPCDPGERIRIGTQFETTVVDELEENNTDDNAMNDDAVTKYKIQDVWTEDSAQKLKVWKKDYDRVIALAKGAYTSTSVEAMRAESLFILARVYHVRQEMDNAHKFYKQACLLAAAASSSDNSTADDHKDTALAPARFGLAQTLIFQQKYGDAINELKKVLAVSADATDALALLGLLMTRDANTMPEGLGQLQKAIELDPLNPQWVILEALALQQHEANYPKALERYQKAIQLLVNKNAASKTKKQLRQQNPDTVIPYNLYANCGVLCHKTNQFDKALQMYTKALQALVATMSNPDQPYSTATMENKGVEGGRIRHKDNAMFFAYLPTKCMATRDLSLSIKDDTPEDVVMADADGEEQESKRKRTWTVKMDNGQSTLGVEVADHVRLGADFESQVLQVTSPSEGTVELQLKDDYVVDENQEPKEGNSALELELWVKRENKILEIPKALTIAFNIARLHEVAGRTLAAIELHKAILKRNPAYVNSLLCLACISVDCGALQESSKWLKLAAQTAPGNPEVLTLVGNLHLSLADWQPAQKVFDSLLVKKVAKVEAYASLSLGNIYFATLNLSEKRYAKHLQYASDYYKRILQKDPANAYAGNGLGTVLAEKAEIFKAKEVFNRVREVSGDSLADALVNLGHIYLAQKKHPEALQMYKNYMKRAEDGTTPITSKSRVDDVVEVLLYISFAYFDWARHTELFNDANAAPADGRYREAMNCLKQAIAKNSKHGIVLRYNLCMTKLQAANCILQKLTRNIPRTVEEVQEALDGLNESLEVVEGLVKDKADGKKVTISSSILQNFLKNCRANISSAESHLEDEKKRAEDAEAEREIRRMAAEAVVKEEQLKRTMAQEKLAKEQEERDRKAEAKMRQVEELQEGWKQEQQRAAERKAAAKTKPPKPSEDDFIVEDPPPDASDEEGPGSGRKGLFDDDSDDDDDDDNKEESKAASEPAQKNKKVEEKDIFGDSDDDSDDDAAPKSDTKKAEAKPEEKQAADAKPSSQDLFEDSSEDDSDEELVSGSAKRGADQDASEEGPAKKRRVLEEDDDD